MRKFTIKNNQLELRSCNDMLLSKGKHTRAEIVEWDEYGKSCITLAYWSSNNLIFVGNRPFESDFDSFIELVKEGQIKMNKKFG